MTLGEFVDDIAVTLGYSHDDALRSRANIAFNVMMAINKIKDQQLTKAANNDDEMSVADMAQTFIVNLYTQDDLARRYFDLPHSIYSLPRDGGLNSVRYHRTNLPANCTPQVARTPFTVITTPQLNAYWGSSTQSPKPDRPYVTRESAIGTNGLRADRVYVWGVDGSIKQLEASLFVSLDNLNDLNPDDEIDLAPEYLRTVKQLVLADEAWLLNIPQERLRNDGRDTEPGQVTRTPPIISVNSPAQLDN